MSDAFYRNIVCLMGNNAARRKPLKNTVPCKYSVLKNKNKTYWFLPFVR